MHAFRRAKDQSSADSPYSGSPRKLRVQYMRFVDEVKKLAHCTREVKMIYYTSHCARLILGLLPISVAQQNSHASGSSCTSLLDVITDRYIATQNKVIVSVSLVVARALIANTIHGGRALLVRIRRGDRVFSTLLGGDRVGVVNELS